MDEFLEKKLKESMKGDGVELLKYFGGTYDTNDLTKRQKSNINCMVKHLKGLKEKNLNELIEDNEAMWEFSKALVKLHGGMNKLQVSLVREALMSVIEKHLELKRC